MSYTTACILAALAVGAGTLLSRVFREGLEAREVLERVPPARLGEGKTGWVRVSGRVHPLGKPLTAPWSGRAAVYWEVEVRAAGLLNTPNAIRVRRRHMAAAAFEIDDGTGRARVRLPEQLIDHNRDSKPEILTALGASKRFSFGNFRQTPAELVRMMPALKLADPGAYTPLSAVERIIAPGDEVIVAGNATLEVDPNGASVGFRSPPTLTVFAATDEHALVLANARGLKPRWQV